MLPGSMTRRFCLGSPVDLLTREILPDWLLSLAYATRRAFFLRRRDYPLIPQGEGWLKLDDAGQGFPHKRVAVTPPPGARWDFLEFKGRLKAPLSQFTWGMWLGHVDGGPLELDLPFGLTELSVRVSPGPDSGRGYRLEIREVGLLDETAAKLKYALEPVGWSARRRGRRAAVNRSQDVQDAFQYGRWLRAFETPAAAASERLRIGALGSGVHLSVVLSPNDTRSIAELEGQVPGRVQVFRSLAESTGEVVIPLEPGVVLARDALAVIVCSLAKNPEADILYTDDDQIDGPGKRSHPSFKPVWSPELIRARNVLRGLVALRRTVIPSGFGGTLDPAERYALILACAYRLPARRIRRIPMVLASLHQPATEDLSAEQSVVAEHLARLGVQARVEPGLASGLRRIRYLLPNPPPRVSIIVPTRNAHRLVKTCVHSIRRFTAYPNYEIVLVDNGSDDPRALACFQELAAEGLVRLLRDPQPFNYPAINNDAVRKVASELICLLNNDIEVIDADWLEEMVSLAIQPDVGAVGAKLLYRNGTIQHGGLLLGFFGDGDHAYRGVPQDAAGYDRQLLVRREISAVTGACLVVRRAVYEEVGGLDAAHFPVGFNDVDFCLKLRALGLRNLWTPHARLLHHESATRGRDLTPLQRARAEGELAALRARWGGELLEDPYHSPNLALDSSFPRLAWPPRGRPPWSA
jgi:O-antigen biosynthesis protein